MCTSTEDEEGGGGGDGHVSHGDGSDSTNWPAVGLPNMFDPDIIISLKGLVRV